jgi:RNA polymerase sigma factor (sigma-70 family)
MANLCKAQKCGGWFLDLLHTCDEVLLLLAREAQCQPARDELTSRYWHTFHTTLPRWVRGDRLTPWDLDDAHQQAFFWIQEAVRAFDPGQLSPPRGSSFHTFLRRVFRSRLADFLRSLRRNKNRFRLVAEPGDWPKGLLREQDLAPAGHRDELRLQLDQALRQLDPSARALWQALSDGKRLCDLPQLLGVSYRTLKRRWRKLREQLILAFRHLKE